MEEVRDGKGREKGGRRREEGEGRMEEGEGRREKGGWRREKGGWRMMGNGRESGRDKDNFHSHTCSVIQPLRRLLSQCFS